MDSDWPPTGLPLLCAGRKGGAKRCHTYNEMELFPARAPPAPRSGAGGSRQKLRGNSPPQFPRRNSLGFNPSEFLPGNWSPIGLQLDSNWSQGITEPAVHLVAAAPCGACQILADSGGFWWILVDSLTAGEKSSISSNMSSEMHTSWSAPSFPEMPRGGSRGEAFPPKYNGFDVHALDWKLPFSTDF